MVRIGTLRRSASIGSVLGALFTASCGKSSSFDKGTGPQEDSSGSGGQAGAMVLGGGAGSSGEAGTGASMAGGGASGSTAGSGNQGGGPVVDEPNISGEWAMFAFEDPVAVGLSQTGNVLSGRGCCTGLYPSALDCCGEIENGSIVDGRAEFGFAFSIGEVYEYAADVFVSADGQRMFGSFSRTTTKMAWARIPQPDPEMRGWLWSDDTVLGDAMATRARSYALMLSAAPEKGGEYSPGVVYRLAIATSRVPLVTGDLGPFWAGEMSWSESEQTLVVGPVPTTDPAFPIGLRLRFSGVVLAAVEANMSSGDRYLFSPMFD